MRNYHKMVNTASHDGFEFDYNHNVIFYAGKVIRLSPHEAERFTAYLRPLVETMQGRERQAVAYLWAVKR